MNALERQMVALLRDLRDNYHCVGVKAEFEAEGTRIEEAMRLKDVASAAGLGLNIKVGGCEALKDMFDAKTLGVERIIGPMVETPYALGKFLSAAKTAFRDTDVELLVNVETGTSVRNFPDMMMLPQARELHGIVIGRVDLTGSLSMDRSCVDNEYVLDIATTIAAMAKRNGKQVVVGGAVSVHSREFFRAFPPGHLDRFETRKVIFGCPGAVENPDEAFLKAIEFELLWLRNKKAYYGAIHTEDDARLAMLEKRYGDAITDAKVESATASPTDRASCGVCNPHTGEGHETDM